MLCVVIITTIIVFLLFPRVYNTYGVMAFICDTKLRFISDSYDYDKNVRQPSGGVELYFINKKYKFVRNSVHFIVTFDSKTIL